MVLFFEEPKSLKISTNAYRTKISLCHLNSLGEPLQFGYKIGTRQT